MVMPLAGLLLDLIRASGLLVDPRQSVGRVPLFGLFGLFGLLGLLGVEDVRLTRPK